jgi:hypothetical protein
LVCLGLGCGFASAGCGGKVTDGSSSEPAASGGTSGAGIGSTQSEKTPAASGVSITLSPATSESGGRSCDAGTTGAFTYQIGEPRPGHTVESGKDGVAVECAVELDSGGNAALNATVSGADANGHKPMSLTVTSALAAGEEMPAAELTFISPDTAALTTLADHPSCTLGPIAVLKSGAVLADFHCPLIGSVDDVASGCRADGTIAFEYCATGRPPADGSDPPSGP